ncbi:MAG TPA: hypothetical protein VMD98_08215 [Bryocella sp.]|nr:hypothetical protein [Bryocella sp.]
MKRYLIISGVWLITWIGLLPCARAQVQLGENWHLTANGEFDFGYSGDYGDQIQSNHGLTLGASGTTNGYFYNPNFINFAITPYYNQSRNDSDSQSLSDASGVNATANFFGGSHFPGTVSYHYDYNTTNLLGQPGVPNFITQGNDQGFGIGWAALFPGWPTLSVGYQQGSGNGTVAGTDLTTSSRNRVFNLHSTYNYAGFLLNGYFTRTSYDTVLPEFLSGTVADENENASANEFGFSGSRRILLNGEFHASFDRSDISSNFLAPDLQDGNTNTSFTTDTEVAGATFHPTQKFGFFVNESYISDLSGFLNEGLISSGVTPVNLGNGSHSFTGGGGLNYNFTNSLIGEIDATYYDQTYYNQNFSGTYLAGTLYYNKRVLDMFSFYGSVIDSATPETGTNNVGFLGNVNFFKRFGGWAVTGNFNYAQNVQSVLLTYTTSYYSYSANVHHRLGDRWHWTAAYNGTHSGLTNQEGTDYHSQSFSTSLNRAAFGINGFYQSSSGNSLITAAGIVPLPVTPGILPNDVIQFTGSGYGGGLSYTAFRRLSLSAAYSRSISDTLSNSIFSRNNTEVFNTQMQYHLRRIGVLAGYTRFTQGITATGFLPGTENSFFVGITRYFKFF